MKLNNNILNSITCPISKNIFVNPVHASDGYIYEYEYLKKWLKIKNISPINNQIITNYTTSYTMKSLVNTVLEKYPEYKINIPNTNFIDYNTKLDDNNIKIPILRIMFIIFMTFFTIILIVFIDIISLMYGFILIGMIFCIIMIILLIIEIVDNIINKR